MKSLSIKKNDLNKELGYLLYFPQTKQFFIELLNNDINLPIFLAEFANNNIYSINSQYSLMWVKDRIISYERNNIHNILMTIGLEQYDEYNILIYQEGRSNKDDYYLALIDNQYIYNIFSDRFNKKIHKVILLQDFNLIIEFNNKQIKFIVLKDLIDKKYNIYITDFNKFIQVQIQPNGYGLNWENQLYIDDNILYTNGINLNINLKQLNLTSIIYINEEININILNMNTNIIISNQFYLNENVYLNI